jgi:hypothetical protein
LPKLGGPHRKLSLLGRPYFRYVYRLLLCLLFLPFIVYRLLGHRSSISVACRRAQASDRRAGATTPAELLESTRLFVQASPGGILIGEAVEAPALKSRRHPFDDYLASIELS